MSKVYKVALVVNGVVTNVINAGADFQPDIDCTMVFLAEVEDGKPDVILHEGTIPGPGYLWDGKDFTPQDLPKWRLLKIAKHCRQAQGRDGGLTFSGKVVEVSLETVNTLKELQETLTVGVPAPVSFKVQDGFLELDSKTLVALLFKVRVRLQELFTLERRAQELINLGKVTKAHEVEALFFGT
jgi:hypothetical protein